MKTKTLLIAAILGTAVAAPAVYAADQSSQSTTTSAQSRSDNSPSSWDSRLLQESNQPGGVGG